MAEKSQVELGAVYAPTLRALEERGLLLVCRDGAGANAMALSWALMGHCWGRPVIAAMVRQDTHTFDLLEQEGDFTINVPAADMGETIAYIGSVSGRDEDKLAQANLTTLASIAVGSPMLNECPINFECRVVQKSGMMPGELAHRGAGGAYKEEGYHRIYWGEILRVLADDDFDEQL